ncbi:MAG: flagellar motor protein MotB [Gammaproteobacteria bacterium]
MLEFENQETVAEGTPVWMITFADLMALLMCFFVMLLSFSEMDPQKYKQVASSMNDAFGIQKEVKINDIPKGTSVIAREFTPGKPTPSPSRVAQPDTTDDSSDSAYKNAQQRTDKLKGLLAEELGQGLIEVKQQGIKTIVRLREMGSFPSGSADLQDGAFIALQKTSSVISRRDRILVSGHTDDIPISTAGYRSNWELSAARAASVVLFFTQNGKVAPQQLEISAHADTKPVAPNTSTENRAKNRRVEIVITTDKATTSVLTSESSQ